MIFSLKSMTLLLKFMKTLNFVTLLLNSMIFPLKSLQSQKIFVKSHVAQNFFWRNLALQEGRMCDVGPQAPSRLIRASAQRHPALRGSLRGKNGLNARKRTQT